MPILYAADAPSFVLPGAPATTFTGLAAPSRGARETSVWRVALDGGTPAAAHALDHEEIIVGLGGHAVAHLGTTECPIGPGDTIIVPAGESFSLANPHTETFEAIAVLPVGGRAALGNGEWFTPPWTE